MRTAPLGANEVLLEVNSRGSARSRADVASLTVPLRVTRPTSEEARAAAEALAARLRAAARTAGVAEGDVRTNLGNSAVDVELLGMPEAGGTEMPETRTAVGSVVITLRDFRRLDQLRRALIEAGASGAPDPEYRLADDREALRRARHDALRTARADAEAYAAALGMRVVRMVRVTERLGMEVFGTLFSSPDAIAGWRAAAGNPGPDVETQLFLGVDFALAPQ